MYAGVDYNLTLCPLQSRLQLIYHEQLYAKVELNPMYSRVDFIPQTGTLDLASAIAYSGKYKDDLSFFPVGFSLRVPQHVCKQLG